MTYALFNCSLDDDYHKQLINALAEHSRLYARWSRKKIEEVIGFLQKLPDEEGAEKPSDGHPAS